MNKEMTHIGMAQNVGEYHRDAKGEPFTVRLRKTKTRWYAGMDLYAKWWPRESNSGEKVAAGGKNSHYNVTELDLSTVRPMTVTELREPLADAVDYRQGLADVAKRQLREEETRLSEALKPLRAFDKRHGWEDS